MTRIDGIFLNPAAAAMFDSFWLTEDPSIRQHKQLHLRLKTRLFSAPVRTLELPMAYPTEGIPHMDPEGIRKLSTQVRKQHLPGIIQALSSE